MSGLMCILLNAAAAAFTVATETWWCLPINIAGVIIGVWMLAVDA